MKKFTIDYDVSFRIFMVLALSFLVGISFAVEKPGLEDVGAYEENPASYSITVRVHDAVPKKADELFCVAHKLDPQEAYIVRFTPHASMETVHHMTIWGCPEPGIAKKQWTCDADSYDNATGYGVCSSIESRQVIYTWANDAPEKVLPEGVGIRISGDTDIKYLIVQLHYAHVLEAGAVDNSGYTLGVTTKRPPQQVGIIYLGNYGYIPPKVEEFYVDASCVFTQNFTIYPIAYRTHSHMLGVVMSGYRIRDDEWTEIGRMSQQLPQMFYEANNFGMDIRKGDILASRCTFNSMERVNNTEFGPTHWDEMCIFYLMFSTYHQENLPNYMCFRNAQTHHLEDFFVEESIPSDISSLAGIEGADKVREKFHINE